MFQTQDMAGQRINGNAMEKLLLTQQKRTFPYPPWPSPLAVIAELLVK
jgi:hypothetical protein